MATVRPLVPSDGAGLDLAHLVHGNDLLLADPGEDIGREWGIKPDESEEA
jgi:hypothetical protein